MRVYIVDDDRGVNDALAVLLQHLGYEVVCHTNSLSLFAGPLPTADDVVFIDLKMPGVNGGQVIRWLQRLSEPPTIVPISALPQRAIRDALKDTGIHVILRKPLTHAAIVRALAIATAKSRRQSA